MTAHVCLAVYDTSSPSVTYSDMPLQSDLARVTARMEYRDTDKKDAHKQKAWRDAVHNFKEAQEALKTTREAYYGCGGVQA